MTDALTGRMMHYAMQASACCACLHTLHRTCCRPRGTNKCYGQLPLPCATITIMPCVTMTTITVSSQPDWSSPLSVILFVLSTGRPLIHVDLNKVCLYIACTDRIWTLMPRQIPATWALFQSDTETMYQGCTNGLHVTQGLRTSMPSSRLYKYDIFTLDMTGWLSAVIQSA